MSAWCVIAWFSVGTNHPLDFQPIGPFPCQESTSELLSAASVHPHENAYGVIQPEPGS